MKKLIGSIALTALLGSAAFAEISISSWGRAIVAPVASNGERNVYWMGTSWTDAKGGQTRSTGLTFSASSENVGFVVDMCGESITTNDQAMFWAKPIDQITVSMGRIQEGTGRGNLCFGLWDWARGSSPAVFGEDFTYMQTDINGFAVKIEPISGLWAVAAVDMNNSSAEWYKCYSNGTNNTRYGIGYDIENIGSVRAQWITRVSGEKDSNWNGKWNKDKNEADKTDTFYGIINPAFDFTGVDGLFLTVGAYIPTAKVYSYTKKDAVAAKNGVYWDGKASGATGAGAVLPAKGTNAGDTDPFWIVEPTKASEASYSATQADVTQVNLGGTYKISDALAVQFGLGLKFGVWNGDVNSDNEVTHADNLGFAVAAGASYDFGNSITLLGDVRYANQWYVASGSVAEGSRKWTENDQMIFLVGVKKALTNGSISVGFEGGAYGVAMPALYSNDKNDALTSAASKQFTWSVPLVIEASF